MKLLSVLLLLLACPIAVTAQQFPDAARESGSGLSDSTDSASTAAPGENAEKQPWSPELVRYLSASILGCCVIVLSIGAFLLRDKAIDAFTVVKFFGVTLIVCMSALLMIVGYGQEQLTPVIGLFGAIAGYLLGKDGAVRRDDAG